MMLTAHRINDLHHVYRCEHLPIRKIERRLRMSWRTIKEIPRRARASGRPSGRVKISSIPAKPIPCVPVHRAEVLPCADPGVTPKAAQRDQRHPHRYGQRTHLLRLANRRSGRRQNRRKCCSFHPGLNMLFESSELPYGATGLQLAMSSGAWRS